MNSRLQNRFHRQGPPRERCRCEEVQCFPMPPGRSCRPGANRTARIHLRSVTPVRWHQAASSSTISSGNDSQYRTRDACPIAEALDPTRFPVRYSICIGAGTSEFLRHGRRNHLMFAAAGRNSASWDRVPPGGCRCITKRSFSHPQRGSCPAERSRRNSRILLCTSEPLGPSSTR